MIFRNSQPKAVISPAESRTSSRKSVRSSRCFRSSSVAAGRADRAHNAKIAKVMRAPHRAAKELSNNSFMCAHRGFSGTVKSGPAIGQSGGLKRINGQSRICIYIR